MGRIGPLRPITSHENPPDTDTRYRMMNKKGHPMTTHLRTRVRLAVVLAALPFVLLPVFADDPPPPSSKKIAAALQPFVDDHGLAGAVTLVADKDRVLSVDTVGFADIAGQKPMKVNTLFWIASQSKSITAAAL